MIVYKNKRLPVVAQRFAAQPHAVAFPLERRLIDSRLRLQCHVCITVFDTNAVRDVCVTKRSSLSWSIY